MESACIQDAWEECELEETEFGTSIGPAVFKPELNEPFTFEDRGGDLWEQLKSIDSCTFMTEPLDGRLRCTVYVWSDGEDEQKVGDISIITYPNRIKIAPADAECPYELFEQFIRGFESNVCELEFLGGLDEMQT